MTDLEKRLQAAWLGRILFHSQYGVAAMQLETIGNKLMSHSGVWTGFRNPEKCVNTELQNLWVKWYIGNHFKDLRWHYHDAFHLLEIIGMISTIPEEIQLLAVGQIKRYWKYGFADFDSAAESFKFPLIFQPTHSP